MPNYRPIAVRAAKRYGIPSNIFLALVNQESGWNPTAGSSAGAVGLTQIHLPSHPDVTYAQATNPRFALNWGAKYLASQYKAFGNWRQALAAYNAGPGRVKDGSWLQIAETTNYVKSILGAAGDVKAPASANRVAADTGVGAPPAPAVEPPDLSSALLQGLGTAGTRDFNPVADLSALTSSVAAGLAAAPPAEQVADPAAAPSPNGKRRPKYSSMKLGKIIGTPGAGTHTLGNWQSDNAWDIAIPVGTPIRADADGVIGNRIGYLGSPNDSGRFAGQRVNLQGRRNAYYYAHLSKIVVKPGQRVRKGQIIGYSGEANGVAHLHFGVQHI